MKSTFFISIGVIIIVTIGAWAAFVSPSPIRDTRPVLAATISPLADIVEHIAGNTWDVVLIIPAGASPHSYSLTPAQVSDLQRAETVFMIGHGLDDQVVQGVHGVAPNVATLVVDKGIALREFGEQHEHEAENEHERGKVDPHYWLTVPNGKQIATNVAEYLQGTDPEHAEVYEANLATYSAQLDALEVELQAMASKAEQIHFIAVHDAWGYLAEHYGFELVGTLEPVEGREPSPSDIQKLEKTIRRYSLTTFYTEPQKQSSAANRLFSDELGLKIKALNPEGGSSYAELMRSNIQALAQ